MPRPLYQKTFFFTFQACQSDGRVVDRAKAWCSTAGIPYYRFSPQMSRDVAMDERGDERLAAMLWEAQSYAHANRQRMLQVAQLVADA
ncbi:hypothetical protein JYU34_020835 [Plutella xylostella]|uniref:Uncharacterized protein n=1 Tax=Plutella xylostella TaxID=51655 RepID=A0ABQ7PS31_PLUXY|nr:hypothetical protein JYU34_020835 [Plutella xylostella]